MSGTNADLAKVQRLIEVGRYAEARVMLGALLAADAESAELHATLANVLLNSDAPTEARTHAETACALAPNNPYHHRLHARVLWLTRDLHRARAAALTALEKSPQSWHSHALFAQIQADLAPGRADAHNAAIRAVDLAPNNAGAHFAAGYVFQAAGKKSLARKAYMKVLELDPHHVGAINNLGVLDGSFAGSTRAYRTALAIDPQHAVARKNLDTTAPRLVFQLWLIGGLLAVVGAGITIRAGDLEHSRPTPWSMALGVFAAVGFTVGAWAVLRHLSGAVTRRLLQTATSGWRRRWNLLVATATAVIGEVACFVPGGGSFARHASIVIVLAGMSTFTYRLRL